MNKQSSSSEKVKRILLAALGVALVGAIVYQFVLRGPESKPKRNAQTAATTGGSSQPATASAPGAQKPRQLGAAAQQEAMMQALLSDLTPLNLRFASSGESKRAPSNSEPGRGNIFAYFVPPPTPPPKPPDPPPIQLVSLQPQTAVAGTPRPLTLVVTGNKIPADAHILIDGSPRVTKRLSETQLSTEISPGDYSLARGINVAVKSQSNPAENSNSIQFVVQAAPEPQFIYKGRLGTLGQPQYNYAVVELNSTKEIKRAKVGDTIMGIWRVDAISADGIDVTLIQYDIKRRVQLQDKVR
jgi:hypothetical protein